MLDAGTDQVSRLPEWVGREVGIAGRSSRLSVPKESPDHWQPKPRSGTDRRERMPQIVKPHVRELGQFTDLAPGLLQIDQMLAPTLAGHHERVAFEAREGGQQALGG